MRRSPRPSATTPSCTPSWIRARHRPVSSLLLQGAICLPPGAIRTPAASAAAAAAEEQPPTTAAAAAAAAALPFLHPCLHRSARARKNPLASLASLPPRHPLGPAGGRDAVLRRVRARGGRDLPHEPDDPHEPLQALQPAGGQVRGVDFVIIMIAWLDRKFPPEHRGNIGRLRSTSRLAC